MSIKAKWHYLYRAVDKHGKTVDFLLRRDRGIAATQAFFRKALASTLPRTPLKVTLDGHVPSRRALRLPLAGEVRRRRPSVAMLPRILADGVTAELRAGGAHSRERQAVRTR
jgi:transposase-like protein